MASAMGILRWSPRDFWSATFYDYTAAMQGYMQSKGIKTEGGVTRNEFLELKDKYG